MISCLHKHTQVQHGMCRHQVSSEPCLCVCVTSYPMASAPCLSPAATETFLLQQAVPKTTDSPHARLFGDHRPEAAIYLYTGGAVSVPGQRAVPDGGVCGAGAVAGGRLHAPPRARAFAEGSSRAALAPGVCHSPPHLQAVQLAAPACTYLSSCCLDSPAAVCRWAQSQMWDSRSGTHNVCESSSCTRTNVFISSRTLHHTQAGAWTAGRRFAGAGAAPGHLSMSLFSFTAQ